MAEEPLVQLPVDLKPYKAAEPLEIQVPESAAVANIQPEDVPEIAKEFNLVGLTREQIRKLGVLGINLESVGSVQVANGVSLVSMQCCLSILQKLQEEGAKTFDNAVKAGSVAAALMRSL